VGFYSPIAPPVPNASSSRICGQNLRNDADATFLDPHISVVHCCRSVGTPPVLTQHATIGGRLPEWQTSKCISSISFVWIKLNFLQHTGDTHAKNDGSEFWNSHSVIFENFFKFSKRHCTVLLWPIWTIMVAAKLDQSRVLVTKFHQNRSTLKGRSAGQRHTDTQTNSAENNGPSGLQSRQKWCV